MHIPSPATSSAKKPLYLRLTFQIAVAIVIGVAIGVINPPAGKALEPVITVFLKLVKMVVGPIIFLTIVVGISAMGDLKKVGRVGLKAIIYFEIITTIALALGLLVANVVRPGENLPPPATTSAPTTLAATLTTAAAATAPASAPAAKPAAKPDSFGDFLMSIIPETFVGALSGGNVLQVLFIAILFGIALALLGERGKKFVAGLELLAEIIFKIMAVIMKFAPIWVLAAMAFTVGKYGLSELVTLAKLLATVYLTMIAFIIVILGGVCWLSNVSIWRYLRHIKDEIILVLGTSSSESALPRMMKKMETFGCSARVVGIVIPAGYSFNLDGTSIYLSLCTLFIAQASGHHLSIPQQLGILAILMLTSKGAAGVSGSGLVTLKATLETTELAGFGVERVTGVDKFMSEARAITNLIGNGVAAIVVSKMEKEFDHKKYLSATTRAPKSDLD